jgi:hypothetical protein
MYTPFGLTLAACLGLGGSRAFEIVLTSLMLRQDSINERVAVRPFGSLAGKKCGGSP